MRSFSLTGVYGSTKSADRIACLGKERFPAVRTVREEFSMEYKAFHDESLHFHLETMVYFSQCTEQKRMSFGELLKLTSDVAVEDFNERGMSRDALLENGFAILVSRCSFRIHCMPKENQRITVHTWEEKSETLQFVRAYEITGEDGAKLVSGLSSWILVEPNARRILPIKKFTMRAPVETRTAIDCMQYGKIAEPDGMELWSERTITYSDIDGNGHTNNSRYGAFAVDAMCAHNPSLVSCAVSDFRINFAKEAVLGDTVRIYGKISDSEKKITVIGKTDAGTSFETEFVLK